MNNHWTILQPDPESITRLADRIGCSQLVARLLLIRDLHSVVEARDFLHPSLKDIRSPFALKGMHAAVKRIYSAIVNKEKMLIFSDYDADGITSAAVLYIFLRDTGADVTYYIPHRIKEGYGLRKQHIHQLAEDNEVRLIITADCGSTSNDAIDEANAVGIDVIITDHHHLPPTLPKALAVLNPKRLDCTSDFSHLAGVGIAFMLTICLRTHLRQQAFWKNRVEPNLKQLCDLVALGTIADAVPLTRENRIFAAFGIKRIQSGRNRSGITSLLKISNSHHRHITSEDIAFQIVPRLNAAGRMQHAKIAVDLLTMSDTRRAADLAEKLNRLNEKRKATENDILADIDRYLSGHPEELTTDALVLHNSHWHEGVLGIVASRLVERYRRPVVLLAVRDGVAKGSARSVPEINLFDCLSECAAWLDRFGGHAAAAGLLTKPELLGDFKDGLMAVLKRRRRQATIMTDLCIDAELKLEDINEAIMTALDQLKPFGRGNPEPLFMVRNVAVVQSQLVGKYHRRMLLQPSHESSGIPIAAIEFNVDPDGAPPRKLSSVAFHLRWNHWQNKRRLQLVVKDTEAAIIES